MKKTHKLLAVMIWIGSAQASADAPRTLASGAPACGNTMGKGASRAQRQARALCRAEDSLASAKERLVAARATEAAYVTSYLTTPRRLANGAPACGNVMSKQEVPPCTAELADLQDARRRHEVQEASARTATARAEVHEATRTVTEVAQR